MLIKEVGLKNVEGSSFVGRGIVNRKIFDKNGNLVEEKEDHNLIVKVGRMMLLKMLAGVERTSLMKMGVGSGGTKDLGNNAFNPIEPEDSDIGLKNQIAIADIESRVVNEEAANPSVSFVAMFDSSDVDSLVNECGLFFEDGTSIFARHTFDTTSLRESSGFKMQISWTIEF